MSLDKFSKLSKLVRMVTLIFRFINKLKHSLSDSSHDAKVYLIKLVQGQYFEVEIEFLKNPNSRDIPELVSNLGLFFDRVKIIRSQAKIYKVRCFLG